MLIETQRCRIRNFQEKDIDSFMEYRNDGAWMRYQGFKGRTREEYRQTLLRELSLKEGVQLAIADKEDDRLIGDLYLKQEGTDSWLGYTISPLKARNGYAYEAAGGVIAWLKGTGTHRILAATLPENTPSVNLLKKLNFVFEGYNAQEEAVYRLEIIPSAP